MNSDEQLIELFLNKNYTIDISKRNKEKLKDIYLNYEIWSKKLNYLIPKGIFSKHINDLGNRVYMSRGYKSYKIIPKLNPEELTDEEIEKFMKPHKIPYGTLHKEFMTTQIQNQFNLYSEKK